jgi:hypothetical protein
MNIRVALALPNRVRSVWALEAIFSYLVCISCKIFIRWRFYLFLKTENYAESRPVCVALNSFCRTVKDFK